MDLKAHELEKGVFLYFYPSWRVRVLVRRVRSTV